MRERSEPQVRCSEDARRSLLRARHSEGGQKPDPGPATKARHPTKVGVLLWELIPGNLLEIFLRSIIAVEFAISGVLSCGQQGSKCYDERMKNVQGKIAVVTGASSGLGKELAIRLHRQGVKVIALSRSVETAGLPGEIIKIPLNIRDLQSIDAAFEAVDKVAERIDILVNCAGRGLIKNLEDTTREEIMDVFGINLKGNIYVAQEVYRRMLPFKSGHILNVSSTTGLRARADEPIYTASKWGMRGFTESLRLAACEHTIRVTGVYPGGMQTAFWNGEAPRDTSKYMKPEDVANMIIEVIKTPESIAPSELVIDRGF